jgi:ATP-dependent DNA helicase RecG
MSATPIPRSLAMTNYGDMDISILDEKPAGRQSILTRVMSLSKVPEILEKLKSSDTQVYWVCPLVKETEKSDLMAAEKRFEELKSYGLNVGLVHGKMKPDEKAKVMNDFKNNKIHILVATTVIEVGVDVPNANIMIVEHAERFGLATLHQLRGRVGRGHQSASCLLLHGRLGEKGKERLEVLRQTDDGFVIADKDLQMRGAGEVLGVAQSGFQQYRLAQLPEHQDLLDKASLYAQKVLNEDSDLKKNENLRILLYLFERQKAIMTLKAG